MYRCINSQSSECAADVVAVRELVSLSFLMSALSTSGFFWIFFKESCKLGHFSQSFFISVFFFFCCSFLFLAPLSYFLHFRSTC